MKKIMFNDRYGLTQAVLDGKKTMTRRLMTMTLHFENGEKMEPVVPDNMFIKDDVAYFCLGNLAHKVPKENQPAYKVGEEVWVAQSYKNLGYKPDDWIENAEGGYQQAHEFAGYTNKMFVRSLYLEHRIRITNIKVERLQDISEEDCLREGLLVGKQEPKMYGFKLPKGTVLSFMTPREAFSALIDRISGKGTWNRNPWVFAYEFELLK